MRIISNFKDYYDYHASVDKADGDNVWTRYAGTVDDNTIASLKLKRPAIMYVKHAGQNMGLNKPNVFIVNIGDKSYPLLVETNIDYSVKGFRSETVLASEAKYIADYIVDKFALQTTKQVIDRINTAVESCKGINEKLNVPISVVKFHTDFITEIHTNCSLVNYVSHLLDASEVYQEIDMFISRGDRAPVQKAGTDKDIIKSKGFDVKTSFRKEKQKYAK